MRNSDGFITAELIVGIALAGVLFTAATRAVSALHVTSSELQTLALVGRFAARDVVSVAEGMESGVVLSAAPESAAPISFTRDVFSVRHAVQK